MAIRFYKILTAGLLCGAIGFPVPAFAASVSHKIMYHTIVRHGVATQHHVKSTSARSDAMERRTTAELNRKSLVGVGPQAAETIPNEAASGG